LSFKLPRFGQWVMGVTPLRSNLGLLDPQGDGEMDVTGLPIKDVQSWYLIRRTGRDANGRGKRPD